MLVNESLATRSILYPRIIAVHGLASRFSNCSNIRQKSHVSYLQFPVGADSSFLDIITACKCKAGLRTIGGCVHAVTQLYWLYHKKHKIDIPLLVPKSTKIASTATDVTPFAQGRRKFKKDLRKIPDEDDDVLIELKRGVTKFCVNYVAVFHEEDTIEVGLFREESDQDCLVMRFGDNWKHVAESTSWQLVGDWRNTLLVLPDGGELTLDDFVFSSKDRTAVSDDADVSVPKTAPKTAKQNPVRKKAKTAHLASNNNNSTDLVPLVVPTNQVRTRGIDNSSFLRKNM